MLHLCRGEMVAALRLLPTRARHQPAGHLRILTRRLLSGDDDGRRSRLRALYEDHALVHGRDGAAPTTDPTVVIADRKIADAARRGVFDDLKGKLNTAPHRSHLDAAQRAGADMAGVLAAQGVAPRSVELSREVDAARAALVAAIRRVPKGERAGDAGLLERRDALDALVTAQNHAAVGDALAFGSRAIQAPRFDFEKEIARLDET